MNRIRGAVPSPTKVHSFSDERTAGGMSGPLIDTQQPTTRRYSIKGLSRRTANTWAGEMGKWLETPHSNEVMFLNRPVGQMAVFVKTRLRSEGK